MTEQEPPHQDDIEVPEPDSEDAEATEQDSEEGDDSDEDGTTANPASKDAGKKPEDPLEKLRKHEESEAKRKADWEAQQAKKKAAADAQMAQVAAMTAEDLEKASVARLGGDVEKLTRRNMKLCVTEHIQTKCFEDPELARLVMHPNKNLINCFKYINRHAREYIEQEMKDNGELAENGRPGAFGTPGIGGSPGAGAYGGDVPDDIVYSWAEDYFRDMEAEEDKSADDKFVPKSPPYVPHDVKKKAAAEKKKADAEKKAADKKAAAAKKAADKKAAEDKAAAEKLASSQVSGQISLGDVA